MSADSDDLEIGKSQYNKKSARPHTRNTKEFQNSTSFPNHNLKHIDYVIIYSSDDADENNNKDEIAKAKDLRESFFKCLEENGIDVLHLNGDDKKMYALLHAKTNRLLIEAEKVKLQMRLNNNILPNNENLQELNKEPQIEFLDKALKFLGIKRDIKKDSSGLILSAGFENSKKSYFEVFDPKYRYDEPFSNTTRSLLVDNILKNFQFKKLIKDKKRRDLSDNYGILINKDEKRYAGLPYMLNKGYFEDAFTLHDRTNKYYMLQSINQYNVENFQNQINLINDISLEDNQNKKGQSFDIRKELHLKWAKLTNFYKYQPLNLIRDYFGESVALYFAWIGHFIYCLYLPVIIGIIFFFIGLNRAINQRNLQSKNDTLSISYIEFTFAGSFDNQLTPFFALILCLWGALFTDTWIRENNRLAFEWDTLKYENDEPDLPEYSRHIKKRKKQIENCSNKIKIFIWNYEQIIKRAISFTVLIFMILIVAMKVAAIVVYRVYIKVKLFPKDEVLQTFIGDVGSSILNSIFINIMNNIYDLIAIRSTKWENYRTQTEFEDNLIFKLFCFQFVNSYASLFYIAFFRNIDLPNGIFNMGPEYLDKCDNDNCMALLSIQVFTVLLIKPFPAFLSTVIWPLVQLLIKRLKVNQLSKRVDPSEIGTTKSIKNENSNRNEKIVRMNIDIEKNKSKSEKTIQHEYTEKVILYGYILLFACSFSLGPLIVLIILAFDLRVDGLRLLWLFRRPVGYKAQDIGAWFYILRFLNVVGIVSNAFIIAFTSDLSKSFLQDKLEYKLLFVVGFEHGVFLIWILILIILPDMPKSVNEKIRNEDKLVKILFSSEDPLIRNDEANEVKENNKILKEDIEKMRYNDQEYHKQFYQQKEKTKINSTLLTEINETQHSDNEYDSSKQRKRNSRKLDSLNETSKINRLPPLNMINANEDNYNNDDEDHIISTSRRERKRRSRINEDFQN